MAEKSKVRKYRVQYIHSERGWGSEMWHVDYDTMPEAEEAYKLMNKDHFQKDVVPDEYTIATGIQTVEV